MPVSCTGCHEGLGLIENISMDVDESGGDSENIRTKKKEKKKLYNYKLFKHRLSTAIGANEQYNVLKYV